MGQQDAGDAGHREGEPAQRGKVRPLTQHILNEQRHDRLHRLNGELGHPHDNNQWHQTLRTRQRGQTG